MPPLRSFIVRVKQKGSRWYRDHRPDRIWWWILLLIISPYFFPRRLYIRWISSGHRPDPRRILIINFGGLGDVLMMTPALRILKEHSPGVKIDLALTHQRVKQAFKSHPYFHNIITMEYFIKGYLSFGKVRQKSDGIFKLFYYFPILFLKLALKRYDAAIIYSLTIEMERLGGALAYALGVPWRVGFGVNQLGFLHRSLKVNFHQQHRVELYIELLQFLGVSRNASTGLHYFFPISEEEKNRAEKYLRTPVEIRRPLLAMHPGGAKLIVPRRWPTDNFVQVARWFVRETGGTVLLTGGPDDREICDQVASALKKPAVNICGRVSVRETAAFLTWCDICVTNDTSVLHLAAAVGVPHIVAIFGPSNPDLLIPKFRDIRYLQADLPCIPCVGSIIAADTRKCDRPIEGECLSAVKPEKVIRTLKEILNDYYSTNEETT